MSLSIKTIETPGAALAALCLAGAASQANATTVTVDLNLSFFSGPNTPIAIDSTTAQFFYSNVDFKSFVGTQNSGMFASSGLGGSAAIDSSLTYAPNPSGIKVAGLGSSTGFIQLSFLTDTNVQEFGFATITDGTLVSITYDDITPNTTPLPAAWALFVGGAGMLGMAAACRRRKIAA